MAGQFVTPDPQDFVNTFGVEPVITDETVRTLSFFDVTGEKLDFSYDAIGRSVSLTWHPAGGKIAVRNFREGATLLRIIDRPDASRIVVDFSTQDTIGQLDIQIFPRVEISERTLLC
ncbi:hypothetical protein [Streptomyces sp. NBC_00354]|uniref:hypothetical protein n=1 Tax=Streptomyces sp. NBC_00354 TaxID=2975723 RepID=UPI002E2711BF